MVFLKTCAGVYYVQIHIYFDMHFMTCTVTKQLYFAYLSWKCKEEKLIFLKEVSILARSKEKKIHHERLIGFSDLILWQKLLMVFNTKSMIDSSVDGSLCIPCVVFDIFWIVEEVSLRWDNLRTGPINFDDMPWEKESSELMVDGKSEPTVTSKFDGFKASSSFSECVERWLT